MLTSILEILEVKPLPEVDNPVKNTAHQALDDAKLIALVKSVAACDETALASLYDLTVSRVYSLACAMTGNSADAEEIVCDVYMQIWQRASQYDERRGSVIAWLMINCRSLALDLLRRRRSQQAGQEKLAAKTIETTVSAVAEELLDLLQEGTAVHKALSELPEIQRRLIALAYFKGLSHQEIAAAMQLPLGSVKSHIRRGLQALRKAIDQQVRCA